MLWEVVEELLLKLEILFGKEIKKLNTMYKRILIITFIVFFNSCLNSKKMKSQNNHIICTINILSKSMNAYGTIYNCKIIEVVEGNLIDKTIDMTILESSFKQYEFLDKEFSSIILTTFTKNKEKEPYPIMPIDGFVDSNGHFLDNF